MIYTKTMKKILFGIFAHPDDEAFGPAGTLLKETRSGTELHLIMLTAGDAGVNPDNHPDISAKRLEEWYQAGALLGAQGMHYLGYKDGYLSNHIFCEVAEKIIEIVKETLQNAPSDASVEFMSFDFTGLSGHIDHIFATRAACLAFYTIKQGDPRVDRIRLMCLPEKLYPLHDIRWLYMDKGRPDSEIDETVDARDLKQEIEAIMRTHASQSADCERILQTQGDNLGLNYFIVRN